jgi:hypothetical protein
LDRYAPCLKAFSSIREMRRRHALQTDPLDMNSLTHSYQIIKHDKFEIPPLRNFEKQNLGMPVSVFLSLRQTNRSILYPLNTGFDKTPYQHTSLEFVLCQIYPSCGTMNLGEFNSSSAHKGVFYIYMKVSYCLPALSKFGTLYSPLIWHLLLDLPTLLLTKSLYCIVTLIILSSIRSTWAVHWIVTFLNLNYFITN